jgi:HSP20 family molecular chaperone IbpA
MQPESNDLAPRAKCGPRKREPIPERRERIPGLHARALRSRVDARDPRVASALHFAGGMFKELNRLIEVATELAGRAAVPGSTVLHVETRVDTLRHDSRRPATSRDVREPMVDVFDEVDHYMLVAELRGVTRQEVKWHVTEHQVVIEAAAERRRYYRELELDAAVKPHTAVGSYENGILELRVWKQ